VIADAQRAVERDAPTTGNWSLGQILEHLAIANVKSIDGFGFTASWPVRLIAGTFLKKRLLTRGLKPGFRLSRKASRILVPDQADAKTSLERLRNSYGRLKTEAQRAPHPFLGGMTRDESDRLQLLHAELHMSFVAMP
jgi:hypothetical protein